MTENKGEIILYQPDEEVKLEVRLEEETVWLTHEQRLNRIDRKIDFFVRTSLPQKRHLS